MSRVRTIASNEAKGSSMSSNFGFKTRTWAMATRFLWPPDSSWESARRNLQARVASTKCRLE